MMLRGHAGEAERRRVLRLVLAAGVALVSRAHRSQASASRQAMAAAATRNVITLFLCGDVMTGRGIDQILPHPSQPQLYEPYVRSALEYVALAEQVNGPIPRHVDFGYVWGDALAEFERRRPDVRIVNLETAITTSEDREAKGINYRMHPANIACLTAAGIDCCTLANNHVLDWGRPGLAETLTTLDAAGIRRAGAGHNGFEAGAPAVLPVADKARVLVFAAGTQSSGVPPAWAARFWRPGVNFLADPSPKAADRLAAAVHRQRQPGDVVVLSIHWGGNWGYDIPRGHRAFAHRLIDAGAADIVYGHSSHHPLAIEVYKGKLILYGCGDFLSDYEGIGGYEVFRNDLALMHFATVRPDSGELERLEMTPLRIKNLRLQRAAADEAEWLRATLDRECRQFGAAVERTAAGDLRLLWR
jgi:poly-gamma-glutamate capsule biosynthesis protein CapA/YwtB (metallophosphatase superfamily)